MIFKQIFLFLFLALYSFNAFSHGDDDHGQNTSITSSTPIIFVKKESQFTINLKTEKVAKGPVQTMIEALGQIIPKPSLKQDLTAIKEGRLTLFQSTSIPVVGDQVVANQVLGQVESLGSFPLKAPFDGVIIYSSFQPGGWVEAGTKIFTIINPSQTWIELNLASDELDEISQNSKAIISPEKQEGKNREAKVLNVSKNLDLETATGLVTLEIDNKDNEIKIGQWVKVYLTTEKTATAYSIPKEALLYKQGVFFVLVKKSPETFEAMQVSVVGQSVDKVFIKNGVNEGDKVVSNGASYLLPLIDISNLGK